MKNTFILTLLILGLCINLFGQDDPLAPVVYPPQETPPPGNPFVDGREGSWRVRRAYVLQVGRTQTRGGANDNVNLRTDGVYDVFFPFWLIPDTGADWQIQNLNRWTFTTQINHYNPFGGYTLENVNPLGIYSASLYGYNNTFPTAVSANARYREIGFDSFEDYLHNACQDDHFSFRQTEGITSMITDRTSHTGRHSIRLVPRQSAIMKKVFPDCEDDGPPAIP